MLTLTIISQAAFGFRLQEKSAEIRQSMFQNFAYIAGNLLLKLEVAP
jgi:hypothetical protein